MIYLFFLLFASQLFLVTPSVIREKQVDSREETLSLELSKTVSGNSDRNTSILSTIKRNLTKEWNCHGQEESPYDTQNDTEVEADACRKVDMIVNFADLGLSDTIVFPWRFNAYRCRGRCPPTQRNTFVNRSLLMALMEEKKGIKINDEACCIPTKMQGLSLIFFDKDENLVKTDYNNIVVEECGCY